MRKFHAWRVALEALEEIVMVPCCYRPVRPPGRCDSEKFLRLGVPALGLGTTARPSSEGVIGVVVFLTHKRERAEAILDERGVWSCPKLPVLDRVLDALHAPRRDILSQRPWGHDEIDRVASWLKGEAYPAARTAGRLRAD